MTGEAEWQLRLSLIKRQTQAIGTKSMFLTHPLFSEIRRLNGEKYSAIGKTAGRGRGQWSRKAKDRKPKNRKSHANRNANPLSFVELMR